MENAERGGCFRVRQCCSCHGQGHIHTYADICLLHMQPKENHKPNQHYLVIIITEFPHLVSSVSRHPFKKRTTMGP